MLKDRIPEIYINNNYNCAETIIRAANEEYSLGLSKDALTLVAGFGGGMCALSTCGCLTGAITVLSKIYVEEKAHETEGFNRIIKGFYKLFTETFGSEDCRDIMPKHRKQGEERCMETILMTAELLDQYLKELGYLGEKVKVIPPEEIKRVKALGFLHHKGTDRFQGRVITVNGKIDSKKMKKIAEAAEKFGSGEVAFTTRLTAEVQEIPYENIEPFREFIAEEGLETGGTGAKVRPVTSCKGTTCQYGLIDTFDLSEKVHYRFYKGYENVKLPHKFKISVGGCPNNCLKPDLNDVGISGRRAPIYNEEICRGCRKCAIEAVCPMGAAKLLNGKMGIDRRTCISCGRCIGKCPFGAIKDGDTNYRVYIGGRWGKKVGQGRMLSKRFKTEEEVLNAAESALLFFKDRGIAGERFSETIERIGFENVEKEILEGNLLSRKEEIINK